jgi:hypothetical protein
MCELARHGVSAIVVCSTPFSKLAMAQARTFGVPDLPMVVIPHPLGGLSDEEIRGRADHAVAQVVELIEAMRT